MTPEEEAYAIAEARIAEAKARGTRRMWLSPRAITSANPRYAPEPKLRRLARIPPALADLTGLTRLDLDRTQVSDLDPLAGLSGLQRLDLYLTPVSDLAPLAGLTRLQLLNLYNTPVSDLAPLAGLSGLQRLYLAKTWVSDLTPLAGLAGLQALRLEGTPVSDLAPLAGLTGLQGLDLDGTLVSDLSPLKDLRALEQAAQKRTGGLSFANCPNITDPVLRKLATKGNPARTVEALAYLRGEGAEAPEERFDPDSFSQTGPGLRFEPKGRYLEMEISPDEIGAMAEPLKPQVRELFSELSSVIGSSNQLGDLKDRADRMRALAEKSTGDLRGDAAELWTLSVYFADYQQQDDEAKTRPDSFVEALEPDIRRALNSASAVGAVFARQFPDARALDEELGRFQRIEIPAEVAEALFEAARKAGVIKPSTAEPLILMAQTGAGSGPQAGKAHDGSLLTARNLAIAAALATMIGYPVAQISGPILSKTGEAIEAEFDLSNTSAKLLREQYEAIKKLFRGQPAEKAFEQLLKMAPPAPKPTPPRSSPKPKPKPKD